MSRVRSGPGDGALTAPRTAVKWALIGLAIHVALVVALVVKADGRPEYFVHFGERSATTPVAREVIGEDLYVRAESGHDGQSFWVLARDPLLLDRDQTAHLLEGRPAYRAQRILYPLLASPWKIGGETALLWGLVVTNLAAVALGAYAAALLAQELHLPPWASLAFALNPGVLLAVVLDTSEAMALAFVLCGLVAVARHRTGWAVAFGSLAVLTKEPSWISFVGVALLAPGLARRTRAVLALGPLVPAGLWAVYQRWRFGWPTTEVREVGLPLQGYVESWTEQWRPNQWWDEAAVGVLILAFAVAAAVRWRDRPGSLLISAALPVAALAFVISTAVVYFMNNSLRVTAPLLTLLAMDLTASREATRSTPTPDPLPP